MGVSHVSMAGDVTGGGGRGGVVGEGGGGGKPHASAPA